MMRVSAVMTRDVRLARPEETVCEAARAMAALDAGVLPVAEHEQVIGVLTDRDIALRAVAVRKGPDTPVREVMTAEVQYCYEDEDVERVASRMGALRVRRLLVVNRDRGLVGIVSLGDIAKIGADAAAREAMSGVSQPGGPHSHGLVPPMADGW